MSPSRTTPSAHPASGRGKRIAATTRAPWMLLAPFLILFILTFVLPIIVAIGSSFTSVKRGGLFGEAGVKSGFAGFANYRLALADSNFIASIGRMLLFGVVQVPVMIIAATILALLLESASAKWRASSARCTSCPTGSPACSPRSSGRSCTCPG